MVFVKHMVFVIFLIGKTKRLAFFSSFSSAYTKYKKKKKKIDLKGNNDFFLLKIFHFSGVFLWIL